MKEALNAYNTAAQIIKDNINEDVPPEILNNIASCLFQLGKYEVQSTEESPLFGEGGVCEDYLNKR